MPDKHPLTLRNTVWLCVSFLLAAAPHAGRLPWWVTSLVATLTIWRLYLARARLALPSKWILFLIVIAGAAGIYLNYRTLFGRDAGVALLVLMLGLKLLETNAKRDGVLLTFLSYFLVITGFLYSQTIPTALDLLLCVWMITSTMIGLQYQMPPRGYRHQLRMSAVLLAQSVPLMLIVFLLFPRVQGPLWGLPADAYAGTSGLSDTMSPGTMSNLILSDAVAFRASFTGLPPPPTKLYWRGPVLWDFDGRTWSAPSRLMGQSNYEARGESVEYVVTVEPHNKRWLFALDLPGRVPPRAFATSDMQLLTSLPLTTRMRYDMVSFLDYSLGVEEDEGLIARALRLPEESNPRTWAFAKRLRQQYPDDEALVQAVLRMYGDQSFMYTLSPPLLGQNAVDEFLFDSKSGFCEHFSSAFAFLVRAAGIPTRIVTGYLGGELNPVGGYLIIRQADAHAWTEVWFKGKGWVRIDPTAAVSPARVERGIAAAVPASDPLPLMMRGDYPMIRQLRLTWDSMANNWNQWVLGYNPERQRYFLSRVGLDDATWRGLAVILTITTGIVTLILALFTLRRMKARIKDPVILAYQEFCAKLARRGLRRDPSEAPNSYATRVAEARPDLAGIVRAFNDLYVELRYGSPQTQGSANHLRRLARDFNP